MNKIEISAKDANKYDKRVWIKMVNGLSGFKSVNLIGTNSLAAGENLCVISSLFHLGATPPLMGFVLRPHGPESPRHTFLNLQDNPLFTINHVNEALYEKAHQTSARYEQGVSEFESCNLESEYKKGFSAPFVKSAQLQLAMRMLEVKNVEQNGTHIIIAQIEKIYLPEQVIRPDGYIDLSKIQGVCLSGLDGYYRPSLINRLSYAKTNKFPQPLTLDGEVKK